MLLALAHGVVARQKEAYQALAPVVAYPLGMLPLGTLRWLGCEEGQARYRERTFRRKASNTSDRTEAHAHA